MNFIAKPEKRKMYCMIKKGKALYENMAWSYIESECRNKVISIVNPHRQVHSTKTQNSLSPRVIFLIALYRQ
ncbi:hypothetical protein BCJMU75_5290 [Bacillus cereus]|nr:hypothetical protein BCM0057_5344 [Bacillus cereus]BCC26778.1 hypothetical protein BCM0079_5371 [Bacillus cereus]BCC38341.1 hypothetical protein BCM0105_5331 [Bacillus cereus]BCC85553.1 hypothetical protein BCJMU75_5290 [Bacillus cereus]BCD14911.1 hypothetical protein BC30075_5828 [Bacillus cereus]